MNGITTTMIQSNPSDEPPPQQPVGVLRPSRWPSANQTALTNTNSIDQLSQRVSLLRQMSMMNALKFGDEIRLFVKSNYLKKPKPVWLDPEHKGWQDDELKGGYIGVYTKNDLPKTTRVLVPPLGDHASGAFVESHFRVEDVFSGKESYGHGVMYGDVIVLVDGDGQVWNNKTGGLFLDGYLSPRPRGSPGEVFISFHKNGKRGEPVQYGDVGVYIDVEDSHRFRVGFNNRLTNYKGAFSSVVGGYLNSDGSGDPLTFVVERYVGKIKSRPPKLNADGQPSNYGLVEVGEEEEDEVPPLPAAVEDNNKNHSTLKKSLSKLGKSVRMSMRLVPLLKSVSVVTAGKVDVMRLSPPYGMEIYLYGLRRESQVEIDLGDESAVLVDASLLLSKKNGEYKAELVSKNKGSLTITWTHVLHPQQQQQQLHQQTNRVRQSSSVVADALKLLLAYAFLLVICFASFRMVSHYFLSREEEAAAAMLTNAHELLTLRSSRAAKRLRLLALLGCFLAGLVTPPSVYLRSSSSAAEETSEEEAVVALTINFKPGAELVNSPPKLVLQRQMSAAGVPIDVVISQEQVLKPIPQEENLVQPWLARGRHPVTGDPLHPAWVRFLNGEQGRREIAMKRWNITCEWRQANNIDVMLERPHRFFFLIKAHYPHYYYGRSKYGNPIYIEQVGKVDMKALRNGGCKLKDMIFHYIFSAEFAWKVLEPAEYGASVTILDVAGISFTDFAGEVIDFVKKATAVIQEHYPERGFMVFIINAPFWFTGIWKVVSSWLPPATKQKIKILGSSFQSELLQVIPKENLPLVYGGSNATPLSESDEELMLRNIACRGLLKAEVTGVGPNGSVIETEQLKNMIVERVDVKMYKSLMSKSAPDGTPLCDADGRPIEKNFNKS